MLGGYLEDLEITGSVTVCSHFIKLLFQSDTTMPDRDKLIIFSADWKKRQNIVNFFNAKSVS